jgi:hypothetical protein
MRPKWMQTHPSGRFMVIEAIQGLNLDFFDFVYFTVLQAHEDKYHFMNSLVIQLDELGIADKSHVVFLDSPTQSEADTIYQTIKSQRIHDFIFVKDSDGYYEATLDSTKNQVAYFDLNDMDNINARSKSYVEIDVNNIVTNIVEKQVVSPTFSVGGYGFENAAEFCAAYEELNNTEDEGYISHVIFEMMLKSSVFYGLKTDSFIDWGTIDAWNQFKKEYKCLFLDIDGVLVENASVHFPPYVGNTAPLSNNIETIKKLYSSGKVFVILTTSRPEITRAITEKELKKHEIPYDELIMGLPHCQRVVINDYAKSNPYPACSAINISRNSDTLTQVLT